jgi:hypothetical protein
MSLPGYVEGLPRIGTLRLTSPKVIFLDNQVEWALAGGKQISGAASRDPDNTGNIDVLRPGMIMGKIATVINSLGTVGFYAPSIIGKTNAAYTSGAGSITLTTQAATELLRRVGSTGSFTLVGPPTVGGVVAVFTVVYSAINTTTGVVTITPVAANVVSGSLIMPTDGSQTPLSFISEKFQAGTGIKVTDNDDVTNLDQPFAWFPIGGVLVAANIINYPADVSLKSWLKSELNQTVNGSVFKFDDVF